MDGRYLLPVFEQTLFAVAENRQYQVHPIILHAHKTKAGISPYFVPSKTLNHHNVNLIVFYTVHKITVLSTIYIRFAVP